MEQIVMTADEFYNVVESYLDIVYRPTILFGAKIRREYADLQYEDAPGYRFGDYATYHEPLHSAIRNAKYNTARLIMAAHLYAKTEPEGYPDEELLDRAEDSIEDLRIAIEAIHNRYTA